MSGDDPDPPTATISTTARAVARDLADEGLLTERQAEAYVLRELEGHGRPVVAAAMEISPSTLDAHLGEARKKIAAATGTLRRLSELERAPRELPLGDLVDRIDGLEELGDEARREARRLLANQVRSDRHDRPLLVDAGDAPIAPPRDVSLRVVDSGDHDVEIRAKIHDDRVEHLVGTIDVDALEGEEADR